MFQPGVIHFQSDAILFQPDVIHFQSDVILFFSSSFFFLNINNYNVPAWCYTFPV